MQTGKMITLEVVLEDTVKNVQKKLHQMEAIPVECQCFFYDGKKLKDHITLKDYNIKGESTLNLLIKKKAEGRLNMRLDAQAVSLPRLPRESSETAATAQEHEEEIQRGPLGSLKRRAEAPGDFSAAQKVLKLAAKYLQTTDASNGFVYYLEKERKVEIVNVQAGSLIISVECGSQQILDELWSDYCSGRVNEMAQENLVTKEILNELGLAEVKLTTTIPEEDYSACRKQLRYFESELEVKRDQLKKSQHDLQYQFCHWAPVRNRTKALLTALKTELAPQRAGGEPPGAAETAAAAEAETIVASGVAASPLVFHRIDEVRQAIDDDINECQKAKAKQDAFGKHVDEFAVFCREHIDSVLASRLVEDEFGFLLDILRGTSSHGAEQPRPALLLEDVNFHGEGLFLERLLRNFLEQLLHSTSNKEGLRITQQILDNLWENRTDEEIERSIIIFMEAKFAEACVSQL